MLFRSGLDADAIARIQPVINLQGSNDEKLSKLSELLINTSEGPKGIAEVTEILSLAGIMNISSRVELDLTLARGLNYYTGAIIEVKAADVAMGSICGGGRYDNLTGIFGLPGVSGVGISFGADRIYDVLNELNLFTTAIASTTKVLFVNFGGQEEKLSIEMASKLRAIGINTEVYPDNIKLKKQFSYADSNQIPWIVMIGEQERLDNNCILKNMTTGQQDTMPMGEIINHIV